MVVLLTHVLCPRKKHVSHLTSAARLACSLYGVVCKDHMDTLRRICVKKVSLQYNNSRLQAVVWPATFCG
jgi:hypothetical protein